MALTAKREPYTYRDLDNFPEDGKRREVIRGDLFVSAAPNIRHQRLIGELFFLIRLHLREQPVLALHPAHAYDFGITFC